MQYHREDVSEGNHEQLRKRSAHPAPGENYCYGGQLHELDQTTLLESLCYQAVGEEVLI